jgi:hypothetical protein
MPLKPSNARPPDRRDECRHSGWFCQEHDLVKFVRIFLSALVVLSAIVCIYILYPVWGLPFSLLDRAALR